MAEGYVVAQCVGCKHERKITAGEVKPGDMPMCDKCYMPMVAKSAKVKFDK